MWEWMIYVFASAVSFPFIVTFGVYGLVKWKSSSTWKAIHAAVHWSTIFYMIAVSIALNLLVHQSFIGWIVLFFLLYLTGVIIYQRKVYTDIELAKAFRIVWRGSFLLFGSMYVLLGCIYIVIGTWGG